MNVVDKALETQLKNIRAKTGKSLEELFRVLAKSGLARHGEMRDLLKRDLGMGHGDANTIVHTYLKSSGEGTGGEAGDALGEIYSGAKEPLRPIHEKLMAAIDAFGPYEIAPKKGYMSLRRKKQFAMIGPATKTQVEVGLNVKGLAPTSRLTALPPGGMCQYKVRLGDPAEVDPELIAWVRRAYDSSE